MLCCPPLVAAARTRAGKKRECVGCCMIQTDSGPGVRHVVCRVMVCNVIMSTQYHAQCPQTISLQIIISC